LPYVRSQTRIWFVKRLYEKESTELERTGCIDHYQGSRLFVNPVCCSDIVIPSERGIAIIIEVPVSTLLGSRWYPIEQYYGILP